MVRAMSVWSVKPRRDPSRLCRYAKVYSRTTTAVHEMTPPPPSPLSPMVRLTVPWMIGASFPRELQNVAQVLV